MTYPTPDEFTGYLAALVIVLFLAAWFYWVNSKQRRDWQRREAEQEDRELTRNREARRRMIGRPMQEEPAIEAELRRN